MLKHQIQVILDRSPSHVHSPGDTVSGHVKVCGELAPKLNGKCLTTAMYGNAQVSWSTGGRNNINYGDEETFFEITQTISMLVGQIKYPFSMLIPSSISNPSSLVAPHGRIEYGVKASIGNSQSEFDQGHNATFILKSNTNVQSISEYTYSSDSPVIEFPYSGEYVSNCFSESQEIKMGCCCFPLCGWFLSCSCETIRIAISHETGEAVPGESLPYILEVDNRENSKYVRNPTVQLIQYWVHIVQHKTLLIETVCAEKVMEVIVPPRQVWTQNETFILPPELLPTQMGCKLLKLMYKLRMFLGDICGVQRFQAPTVVETDIVIGDTKYHALALH